ncbi:MAG: ABC transporter ATP-binding protein/permease [Alphaproteobacteria bacterium]|nr:ABC transporter ATP-binding protein/permease [Alphaproteobacteria bacterium]
MHVLAAIVALFSAAAAITGLKVGDPIVLVLAAASLLSAFTTYKSRQISTFLQIFVAIFAAETVIFGVIYLIGEMDLWPPSLEDYEFPESLPLTMAVFAILVFAVSHIPVVQSMTRIADRYFDMKDRIESRIWPFPSFTSSERYVAIGMVVFLVLINQLEVGISVRLSFFSRDMYNALEKKDAAAFWIQILFVFTPWAFTDVAAHVIEYIVQSTLIIRWRRWLTNDYVNRWLDNHTHYRMSLAGGAMDNPDQRISEDINRFIDGGQVGYGIYSFSIALISTLSSLVSFAIVLWGLSANVPMPFTNITFPGSLFWIALLYAFIGSVATHWIGSPLVGLNFIQQRYEANFRFSLARIREYAEQIALLSGERREKTSLRSRFADIVNNYFRIIACRKNLIAATSTYAQASEILPYLIVAPLYFAEKVPLGIMMQTARGFLSVQSALNFFVNYYVFLADFKAVLDRLTSFDAAIANARKPGFAPHRIAQAHDAPQHLDLAELTVKLPGGRELIDKTNLRIDEAERVLVNGPSGSGKSTLLRAISGIWPYGEGTINLPADTKIMLLPQRPYIPIGTLRAAVTYPENPDRYEDSAIIAALQGARLGDLASELDMEDFWSQRLSGGEQQRLAIARALLTKPDWLFLDEATSAVDEAMEADIYEILLKALPTTTLVSIGHRASVGQFHKRRFEMRPAGSGHFSLAEAVL